MSERIKVKTITQKVHFSVTPHEVFEALMDEKKHARFTGGKVTLSRKVGGKFTAYDGYAEGTNVEIEKDHRIVQAWRASDWPEGHYSVVTFSLKKSPSGGTMLAFTQKNVPADMADDIAGGWKEYYWDPMKKMFEKG